MSKTGRRSLFVQYLLLPAMSPAYWLLEQEGHHTTNPCTQVHTHMLLLFPQNAWASFVQDIYICYRDFPVAANTNLHVLQDTPCVWVVLMWWAGCLAGTGTPCLFTDCYTKKCLTCPWHSRKEMLLACSSQVLGVSPEIIHIQILVYLYTYPKLLLPEFSVLSVRVWLHSKYVDI